MGLDQYAAGSRFVELRHRTDAPDAWPVTCRNELLLEQKNLAMALEKVTVFFGRIVANTNV